MHLSRDNAVYLLSYVFFYLLNGFICFFFLSTQILEVNKNLTGTIASQLGEVTPLTSLNLGVNDLVCFNFLIGCLSITIVCLLFSFCSQSFLFFSVTP